tara:strand:+ start:22232 stop:22798 length:567 start_codon:yes stop_codon:yes gene_type:complete
VVKKWEKRIFSNVFLTLQICEQIIEKKNRKPIEFVVFFSHTVHNSKLRKKFPFLNFLFVKKAQTSLRVRYGETDQMGIVYYGNYAQYLEQGRTEWLRNIGFSYKWMEENGIHLPVINLNIDYKAPAYYDDILTITTSLTKIPTARIDFYYEIHNQEGKLLITATTTLVFVNSTTNRPRKAPDYLLEKL